MADAARLAIKRIRTDGGTQSREKLNEDAIARYTGWYSSNSKRLPPVVVFNDGSDYWLADGFHRVTAATAAGKASILADVRRGTRRDAILFSVGANIAHGHASTPADRRYAATLLLRDAEWRKKADRWIADKCGVHHASVGRWRSELALCTSSERSRAGRDGKVRKLPGKSAATKPAASGVMPVAKPKAPLAKVIELHAAESDSEVDDATPAVVDAQDSDYDIDPDQPQISVLNEFSYHAQRFIRAWRWDSKRLIDEFEVWGRRARAMVERERRNEHG